MSTGADVAAAVGFDVTPLRTCPHLASGCSQPPPPLPAALAPSGLPTEDFAPLPCGTGAGAGCSYGRARGEREIWLCAQCGAAGCGRAASGHAAEHGAGAGHALALSLADLSAWCYTCDSYVSIWAPELFPLYSALHARKFGEPPPARAATPTLTLGAGAGAPRAGGQA